MCCLCHTDSATNLHLKAEEVDTLSRSYIVDAVSHVTVTLSPIERRRGVYLIGGRGLVIIYAPVLTLDPGCEKLAELHGEAVTVQMVQLLQVARLQLLQLVPLGHADLKDTETHTGHCEGLT